MPIQIVRNDITKMSVDAIVNAANPSLLGGGGVDGAIHRAAGPELLQECRALGGCPTGEARITRGYALPCRHIIHTVGPIWRDGRHGEKRLLAACYRNSLLLAQAHGCKTVAFPLISSGAYGYPKEQALKVAMDSVGDFLLTHDSGEDMTVFIVVYGSESVAISAKLFADVQQYIDDNYVDAHTDYRRESVRARRAGELWADACAAPVAAKTDFEEMLPASLEDALSHIDESFSQMVLRKIAEKGMKNSDCYKKANIDKKLFSKINNDIHYKPKKPTALALAVALELSLDETRELLMKAGLALSRSEKFDIIVEYFISRQKYDIFEINEVLFFYDQPLLGAAIQ